MNLSPEHLHVMVNHIPLVGLAVALIPLLIGLIGRRPESLCIGLVIAALCGGSTAVVMWSGEEAEHEWLHSETADLDADAYDWAEEHEHRAELGSKVMYASAGLAVLGLLAMGIKKLRKPAWVLGVLTTLGCVASVAAAAWIADVGGKISHPEFRDGPPPEHAEEHAPEHTEKPAEDHHEGDGDPE